MASPLKLRPNFRNLGRKLSVAREYLPSWNSILVAFLFFIGLRMNGDIMPLTRRGFFCHDSSISYPYLKETFSVRSLLLMGLVLPAAFIYSVEKLKSNFAKRRSHRTTIEIDTVNQEGIRMTRRKRKISEPSLEELTNNSDVHDDECTTLTSIAGQDCQQRALSNHSGMPRSKPPHRNKTNHDDKDEEDEEDEEDEDQDGDGSSSDDDAEVILYSSTKEPISSSETAYSPINQRNRRTNGNGFIDEDNVSRINLSEIQFFFFGISLTIFLTGVGKVAGGRLRPHFMQRCIPDIDCSDIANRHTYITEFNCTNKQLIPRDYSYITTSWPSGHASAMFYSALYVAVYLHQNSGLLLDWMNCFRFIDRLFMGAIQAALLSLASYVAISRITDYHHHPFDVFSGAFLGAATMILLNKSRTYFSPL